jgi:queuine tRNA-ribosyltransferase
MMLLSWNNLAYYQDLMVGLRGAITDDRLDDFIETTKEGWRQGEAAA